MSEKPGATASGLKVVFKLGNKVASQANVPKQQQQQQAPSSDPTHSSKKVGKRSSTSPSKLILKTGSSSSSKPSNSKRKRESTSTYDPSHVKKSKSNDKKEEFDEGTIITAPRVKKFLPLKKVINTTLKKLIDFDQYKIFYEPVKEEEAPGYFSVISKPMDFSTMRKKFNDDKYHYFSQVQKDFELICNNAMLYNRPDTFYYEEAKRLLKEGKNIFKTQSQFLKPEFLKPPKQQPSQMMSPSQPSTSTPSTPSNLIQPQNPLHMPINQDLIVQRILPSKDDRIPIISTPIQNQLNSNINSTNLRMSQHKMNTYQKKIELDSPSTPSNIIPTQHGIIQNTPNISTYSHQYPHQQQHQQFQQTHQQQRSFPIDRSYSYSLFNFYKTDGNIRRLLNRKISYNYINYTRSIKSK